VDDKDGSNIVQLSKVSRLKTKKASKDISKKVGGYGYCSCVNVFVDEYKRMLECRRCGITIDPFDYIWKVAVKEDHKNWTNIYLASEIDRLSKKLDTLKKEEKRIKARIRNAKKKVNSNKG